MKKIILIAALFLTTICNALTPNQIDSLVSLKIDTTIVLTHPNSTDSINVVKIVNGIITITTVFIKQPIVDAIIKSPVFGGGIVGFILGIWRFFEKKRLRKKGLLTDGKK